MLVSLGSEVTSGIYISLFDILGDRTHYEPKIPNHSNSPLRNRSRGAFAEVVEKSTPHGLLLLRRG